MGKGVQLGVCAHLVHWSDSTDPLVAEAELVDDFDHVLRQVLDLRLVRVPLLDVADGNGVTNADEKCQLREKLTN